MPIDQLKQYLKTRHLSQLRRATHLHHKYIARARVGTAGNYFIDDDYVEQQEGQYFDAIAAGEEWQVEVYALARRVFDCHGFESVVDIGCGSATKLLEWFENDLTIGVDVSPTYEQLVERHPDRMWMKAGAPVDSSTDLLIMADVIEHVSDPVDLLNYARGFDPKYMIISTPDRAQFWTKQGPLGPPKNRAHMREWTFTEFGAFMRDQFDVVDHHVSNFWQATQVVVARPHGGG